ncbi:hypothetical protein SAMN05720471_10726 [Fibrobacter sp. UWP2]|nr:hypothetical protein SAMN05720471_10726 [Fibrobacter sp. UWP2]
MDVKRILLWICCLAISVLAAETPSPAKQVGNIPLPHQSAYTGVGLGVGIGAGIFNPTEDCDCLGIWQDQLEYFYTDWLSAGVDVRFFGGDLDGETNVLYQRYRGNVRFHFPFNSFDLFLAPVFGLENTDIEEIRDEWDHRENRWWLPGAEVEVDSTRKIDDCEKMFSLDGFSVGAEMGLGWRFSKFFGLTGSALYEYNFSAAQLLTLSPGVAFNLGDAWSWAQNNLFSAWISVEVGFQRYFNRGVSDWANSAYLGLQIGI